MKKVTVGLYKPYFYIKFALTEFPIELKTDTCKGSTYVTTHTVMNYFWANRFCLRNNAALVNLNNKTKEEVTDKLDGCKITDDQGDFWISKLLDLFVFT